MSVALVGGLGRAQTHASSIPGVWSPQDRRLGTGTWLGHLNQLRRARPHPGRLLSQWGCAPPPPSLPAAPSVERRRVAALGWLTSVFNGSRLPLPSPSAVLSEQSAKVPCELQEGVQGPRAWRGWDILCLCDLGLREKEVVLRVLPFRRPAPLSFAVSGTFGGCWAEAAERGSPVQGFWVLHISQPGRPGALMNVQEGQDQLGWEGGAGRVAVPPSFQGPESPRPTLPSPLPT